MNDAEYDAIRPHNRDWYGPAYFKFAEVDHGPANDLFGEVVHLVFRPTAVIDFGCGTGRVLAALRRRGVEVLGVNGHEAARPFIARHDADVARRLVVHDLATPWTPPRGFDVALCIETLEHIEPAGGPTAVATLCAAAPLVVISTPPPTGRGNPLHVNEQPIAYWADLFAAHGYAPDPSYTDPLRAIMRAFDALHRQGHGPLVPAWFFSSYCVVYRRTPAP
jgi:2-polyprenyl-3-methyl-5-hydroxy-6-metoxy-1,4-benzoquinol methylase